MNETTLKAIEIISDTVFWSVVVLAFAGIVRAALRNDAKKTEENPFAAVRPKEPKGN